MAVDLNWYGIKVNEVCNYPYNLGCEGCKTCLPNYSDEQIRELAHITFDEAQDRFGLIDLDCAPQCIKFHFKSNIEDAQKEFEDGAEDRANRLKNVLNWLEENSSDKEGESAMPAEKSTKDTMYKYDVETNAAVKCANTDSDIKESNVRKPKNVWIIIETRCSVDDTSLICDLESNVFGDLHYSSLDAEATLNKMYEEYLRINKTMNLGLVLDLTRDEDGLNPVFQSRFLQRNSGCPDIETVVCYTIKKLEVAV